MRRYAIQGRDDYRKYNQLAGSLRQLAHRVAALDPSDPFRHKQEDLILEKLFSMGLLGTGGGGRGKLSDVEHVLVDVGTGYFVKKVHLSIQTVLTQLIPAAQT